MYRPSSFRPPAFGHITKSLSRGQSLALLFGLAVLCWFVPYLEFLALPFRMINGLVHGASQMAANLLTGGHIGGNIYLYGDGHTREMLGGGNGFVVHAAGYLGSSLFGAALLTLWRRETVGGNTLLRLVAAVTGGVTVLAVWPWACLSGFCWGVALTLALLAMARFLKPAAASLFAALIGVQCLFGALFDLRNLLAMSWFKTPCMGTDVGRMAAQTHLPAFFWAMVWTAVSLALMVAILRPALAKR